MELLEYMLATDKTIEVFAKDSTISNHSLFFYRRKQVSPGLLNALKIFAASGGNVSLVEMLSKKDLKALNEMVKKRKLDLENPKQKNKISDDLSDLEMAISETLKKAKK